jgi:hypothetical protein
MAKKETKERLSSSDYVNDGGCPICGKYQKKIAAGKMKPCFMWERIEEEEDEDE